MRSATRNGDEVPSSGVAMRCDVGGSETWRPNASDDCMTAGLAFGAATGVDSAV